MRLTGFFDTLRASRKKLEWFLTSKGMIRAHVRSTAGRAKAAGSFCPLTGANFVKTGKRLSLGDTKTAGHHLGIRDVGTVGRIVSAADAKRAEPKLRMRILSAVGLA